MGSAASSWMPNSNVYDIKYSDVVVFPGGADINPDLYGARKHPKTSFYNETDKPQIEMFQQAIKLGKPMVGICRGAQLLCAMAGGQLVQDQTDPNSRHPVYTYDGKIIEMSSCHHQAMFPWRMKGDQFKVLGWTFGQSPYHQDGDKNEMVIGDAPLDMEVEIAFFPEIKALCIQGHPEFQYASRFHNPADLYTIEYLHELLERFMDGDKFENAHDCFRNLEAAK